MNYTTLRSFSTFLLCIFCFFFLSASISENEITSISPKIEKSSSIKKEKKQSFKILDKKENLKSNKQESKFQTLKKIYKLQKAVKKSKKFKHKKAKNNSPRFLAVLGLIFSGIGFLIIASLAFIALSSIAFFISIAFFLIILTIITGDDYLNLELSDKTIKTVKISISLASAFGLVGLILSIIALRKLNKSKDLVTGNNYTTDQYEKKKYQDGTRIFAIAGIVLGIIALFSILFLFLI